MEARLAQLFVNTQLSSEAPRKLAEIELIHSRTAPEFPTALLNLAATKVGYSVEIRQAALSTLRKFIEDNWSPDGHDGVPIPISDETKAWLRQAILELVLSPEDERKIKVAARYVVLLFPKLGVGSPR